MVSKSKKGEALEKVNTAVDVFIRVLSEEWNIMI